MSDCVWCDMPEERSGLCVEHLKAPVTDRDRALGHHGNCMAAKCSGGCWVDVTPRLAHIAAAARVYELEAELRSERKA